MNRCSFAMLLSGVFCERPAERAGFCIFHLPKRHDKQKVGLGEGEMLEVERHFMEEFKQLFDSLLADPNVRTCDFRGFSFPLLQISTKVNKDLDFTSSQFHIVDFSGAELSGKVTFGGCQFHNFVDFTKCSFHDEVSFDSAVFRDLTLFDEAVFEQDVSFMNCEFRGLADFTKATFGKKSRFWFAKFHDVRFKQTAFKRLAEFWKSSFSGEADFSSAHFRSGGIFSRSQFDANASFDETSFGVTAEFERAVIRGRVRFVGDDSGSFKNALIFRGVELSKDAEVVFDKVDLRKSTFVDTNVEAITFRSVRWLSRGRKRTGGAALWDEFRGTDDQERDYERIAENYRQLVLNYERRRDYETAESFHIGEMEMRRKEKASHIRHPRLRKMREWLNSYAVYRALSNYGTSYIQALLVLVIFLCFFSLAFLYSGFRTTSDTPQRTIEYNILPDSSHHRVSAGEWLGDYTSALSLCASIVTFQKDRFYEPLPGISRLWLFSAVIGFAGQVAMTLLALRRRFRR